MTPHAAQVRSIRREDLVALADLCVEHAAYEGAGHLPEGRAERLEPLLFGPAPRLYGLVVEQDRQLVGFATWTVQVSTWDAASYLYLDCLFLRPSARGHGLGRELMARLARTALDATCDHVQWQTPSDNAGAIRFYDRLGATSRSKVRYVLDGDALASLASHTSHA
ncbi:MAG: hypothetical protein Rubg2KO_21580 [Rubricoccaceae bacterium]